MSATSSYGDNDLGKPTSGQQMSMAISSEPVDGAKVNKLLEQLTDRLSTDFHGNFFIEGGSMGKDGRHGQLREVVELTQALQCMSTTLKTENGVHNTMSARESKKAANLNEANIAFIKTAVEEHLAGPLKQLADSNESLREEVRKTVGTIKGLNEDVRKLVSDNMQTNEALKVAKEDIPNLDVKIEEAEEFAVYCSHRVQSEFMEYANSYFPSDEDLLDHRIYAIVRAEISGGKWAESPAICFNKKSKEPKSRLLKMRFENLEAFTKHASDMNSKDAIQDRQRVDKLEEDYIRDLHEWQRDRESQDLPRPTTTQSY